MNDADYREWFKQHAAAFPGIIDWMKKQGPEGSVDISKAWKECLSGVGKDDALAATRAMNLGDVSSPAGFGDHARAVRKVSRKFAFQRKEGKQVIREIRYVNGERVYDCKFCLDTGWVMVVNIWRNEKTGSRPLSAFWAGITRDLPKCAIECSCVRGDRFKVDTMFVFDPVEAVESRASRFEQWWADGRHLGNRVGAFDTWNRGA